MTGPIRRFGPSRQLSLSPRISVGFFCFPRNGKCFCRGVWLPSGTDTSSTRKRTVNMTSRNDGVRKTVVRRRKKKITTFLGASKGKYRKMSDRLKAEGAAIIRMKRRSWNLSPEPETRRLASSRFDLEVKAPLRKHQDGGRGNLKRKVLNLVSFVEGTKPICCYSFSSPRDGLETFGRKKKLVGNRYELFFFIRVHSSRRFFSPRGADLARPGVMEIKFGTKKILLKLLIWISIVVSDLGVPLPRVSVRSLRFT